MKIKKFIPMIIILLFICVSGIIVYKINYVFKNISSNKFIEILDKDFKGLIYIGRPTCNPCNEVKPELEKALKSNGIKCFYYNTDKEKKRDLEKFNIVKEKLNLEFVPLVMYYDGEGNVSTFNYSDFSSSKDSIKKFIEQIDI